MLGRLDELIAGASEAERAILDRLAAGPPIGGLRDAELASAQAGRSAAEPSPARGLVERGLLVPIDNQTVELPRELALRCAGNRPDRSSRSRCRWSWPSAAAA